MKLTINPSSSSPTWEFSAHKASMWTGIPTDWLKWKNARWHMFPIEGASSGTARRSLNSMDRYRTSGVGVCVYSVCVCVCVWERERDRERASLDWTYRLLAWVTQYVCNLQKQNMWQWLNWDEWTNATKFLWLSWMLLYYMYVLWAEVSFCLNSSYLFLYTRGSSNLTRLCNEWVYPSIASCGVCGKRV